MKLLTNTFLVFILVLSSLTLRAQSERLATTPLQFNDQLSSITDSLFAHGQQWGTQFNEAYKSKDYTSLRPYRQNLERFVTAQIAKVGVMKDVNNSKPLRMAMLSFLTFEKSMITKAFVPMEKISPTATSDEINAAIAQLKIFSAEEGGELQKVASAQEAYAAENGFTIEPAKPEAK